MIHAVYCALRAAQEQRPSSKKNPRGLKVQSVCYKTCNLLELYLLVGYSGRYFHGDMDADHATTPRTIVTGGNTEGPDTGLIIGVTSLVVIGGLGILTWLFGSGVCKKPIKRCKNKDCLGCLKTADVENPQPSRSQVKNQDSSEGEHLIAVNTTSNSQSVGNTTLDSRVNFEVHTHQESAEVSVPGTSSPSDETNRSTVLNQRSSSDHHTERSALPEGNHSSDTTAPNTVDVEVHTQANQESAEASVPGRSSPSDHTDRSTVLNQTISSDHHTDMSALSEDCGGRPLIEAEHQREDMPTATNTMKDIFLMSTSENTPHVKKMKDMFQRNGWIFTTPFDVPLGEPVMHSAEMAVLTHKHIVVLFDEGDCSKKNGEYNMTIEIAFKASENTEIGGRIIPIRCCDEKSVPLRLKCLRGRAIDDDDLEKKMIQAIGTRRKIEGEAWLCLASGGRTTTAGTDEMDVGNGRSPHPGNIVLTNEYFMDLAKEIGSEWRDLAIRLEFSKAEIERITEGERDVKYRTLEILQRWHQRTPNVDVGTKVEILCKSLLKCGREDLSAQVKAGAELCS